MAVQLRLYPRSAETFDRRPDPNVRISLRDLLPLIALAKRHNYLWLEDFIDDEVCVTSDLYDVLRAFTQVRRPSA
ncbi:MAG: hypothetical protein HY040_24665 [Planctomycetes bacterium]|nr:hypothetical protein [Planctomycetota bacterium]